MTAEVIQFFPRKTNGCRERERVTRGGRLEGGVPKDGMKEWKRINMLEWKDLRRE